MPFVIGLPAQPPTHPAGVADGTPQFAVPFHIGSDGLVATTTQDSPQEIVDAIYNFLTCPAGAKLGDPSFGITSPLGSSIPLNLTPLLKQIQAVETRPVSLTAIQQQLQLAQQQPVNVQIVADVPVGS